MKLLLIIGFVIAILLLFLVLAIIYYVVSVSRKNDEIAESISVETQIRVNNYNMYIASLQAKQRAKTSTKANSNVFRIIRRDENKDSE